MSCNFSNFIISVERIKQFMQMPQEPPKILEDERPPSSWPSNGRIEFKALKVKYRPNASLLLNGITSTFKEGTRVGVIGMTGSRKTTLLSAASADLSILNFDIPYSITFVVSVAIDIVVTICIMVLVTWPVLIVAIPAMVASKYVQGYYQASSRELMRINGTTKAPVMNFAAETSLGVVTQFIHLPAEPPAIVQDHRPPSSWPSKGRIDLHALEVNVSGTVAYVSQTSWIQSGTVRDNILFGKPMDKTRYDDAIKVCALDKDINDFSHGDLTEIGQRGINMSGGQKQRIQLARAVYNDADIYLLDDPFSAVDAHTAAILFNDCVMMALREKTVILVTHQVEFLSQVDTILVMEGGKVTQAGNYVNLLTSGTAFEQLVSAHKEAISELEQNNENKTHTEESQGFYLTKNQSEGEICYKGQLGVQLTQEEEKEIGDVGWKTIWDYISFSRCSMMLCWIILGQFAFVVLQAASTFWLVQAIEIPKLSSVTLIGVYSLISFGGTAFAFLRTSIGAHLGLKASTAFFSSFTTSIFNAPMLFFDSTPVGRILTRASSDLTILDFDIPFSITFVASVPIEILMIIGIMVYVTWQVLIVAVPGMVASKYVQGYYQASARELIRINGTTKAPVMNFAAETSLGLVTVRAFNMADRFFKNYLKLVDTDAALFFYSNAAMEWLVLRIETLQNLTVITAALLLVLVPQGYVSPGLVGLSLSYTFTLTGTQIFLTRWYCNLLNYIISVERIKQFIQLPEEPPAIVEDNRPPSSWPSKGRIDLQALEAKYRPNAPLVLKGITCTFKEGSRVGVVGRTGSGKSTLISALFRLVEPASGDILIDGINICSIGLKDLKIKLSIIPQEPTLFKGSIRTNLDPLGLYSDDDLWKALEKCQLKETISRLPNLLDSLVSDEGGNWSLGQRQLFCLGRVLLKRNRILVLDEATASIDSATDAILQQIIRQEFAKCTVITVAHRVPTVIDSDMVMVLSYGKLVEYDEPSKLMDTNSSFSKLVAEYWSSCRKNSPQTLAGSNIE
ncbi:ABC transporter C family member 8 [Glycine soja]|nr:ABC transporter C family member 8 [Glycine soja]